MTRPIDRMVVTGPVGARVISGTGTYVDGSVLYGSAEFESEHGMTFAEFGERMMSEPVEGAESAEFFKSIRRERAA